MGKKKSTKKQNKKGVRSKKKKAGSDGLVEDAELALHWAKIFARLNDRAVSFLIEWLGSSTVPGDLNMRETFLSAQAMLIGGTAYRVFTLKKASGGWRTVTAPSESLKVIQRALLDLVFSKMPVHYASHAGLRRRSPQTAVRQHAEGSKAFYLIDLKDAYPSVNVAMVHEAISDTLSQHLESIAPHLSTEERASIISFVAEVCCYKNQLAQGSPASVAVMNIVRFPADCAIRTFLRQQGDYRFTAYVDNIDISRIDNGEIPKAVRQGIQKILTDHGFRLNRNQRKRKEDYLIEGASRAPVMLGLVPHPDGRVTVRPATLKKFRAALRTILDKNEVMASDRQYAAGIIGFLHNVYGDKPPSTIRSLYLACCQRFASATSKAKYGYSGLASTTSPKQSGDGTKTKDAPAFA